VFPFLFTPEHCTAECECDFSVLARLQTPLRKGPMHMQTVERKMFLMLNLGHWHPLPMRVDEALVKEMFERFRAEVPDMLVPNIGEQETRLKRTGCASATFSGRRRCAP
jgi:hypothetical protein